MKFFPITKKRLIHHIDYYIRKSALGVINWFVDEEKVVNVILYIRGIYYIYREQVNNKKELDPTIQQFITDEFEILGIIDLEKEYEEPYQPTVDDYFQLKRLG